MGVRTRGVLCLKNQISSLPLEGCGSERPADSQVCNNGPCENRIEWFTGPWSQVGEPRKAFPFVSVHLFLTAFVVCDEPVLCRVRCRQPAEGSGVFNEIRRRSLRHAAVRVLIPEPAARPAELQPEGLWSQVVPHGLERCE